MAERRFGPTLGAGVALIEKEAERPITPARLGVTAYAGILEKGPVGEIFLVSKKTDFLRRAGSYIPESLIPDAAFDFYNLSNGNGELWLCRVTDGTEVASEVTLYSRNQPVRRPVLKFKAKNGGRWGGKKKFLTDEYVSITQTTLTTGKTMLKNQFKDAQLKLSAVPGKSFKVISNTVGGILTFASDTRLIDEINGNINKDYILELFNLGKSIAVQIADGQDNPEEEFHRWNFS
jgi:hypothetical protein